jgi:transcriptional regulator with XRE-family HTH domain
MANQEIFGVRLKKLREQYALTQKGFAQKVFVSAASLSAYEQGTKSPSLGALLNIAEHCNVSIDWLCGLSEIQSIGGEFNTYADVISILLRLGTLDVLEIGFVKDGCDQEHYTLSFSDETLNKFLEGWQKIAENRASELIDDDVYALWIKNTLSKHQGQPLNATVEDESEIITPVSQIAGKAVRAVQETLSQKEGRSRID